ncbi:MAG: sialidase family protein, partial [Gammaproteobacteria bacterium]
MPPPGAPLVRVSGPSPYPANCGGTMAGSIDYENAEVEPYVAVNPINTSNVIGIWQQDRWSDGGAHGLVIGRSLDSGRTWSEQSLDLSVCGGGNGTNGGDYARASDPWVTFSPNGVAYVISISFSGASMAAGSLSSVLVSRSTDGGATWSNPATLILD